VVTGGGGFLGSRVVSWLLQRGAKDVFVPRSERFNLDERDACREVVQGG
jgi:GDP-L-fucose synthase